MNNVSLIGRPTKDPVTIGDGNEASARWTLAVDRRKGGADFIDCFAFGKTADFAAKYMKKGVRYGVTGEISTGSYERKDGQKVYTTSVYVKSIEFCEWKPQNDFDPVEDGNIPFI